MELSVPYRTVCVCECVCVSFYVSVFVFRCMQSGKLHLEFRLAVIKNKTE